MRRSYYAILSVFIVSSCALPVKKESNKGSHPSHIYTYVAKEADEVGYLQTDYIPLYSDIYHRDGTRRIGLTSTLSIRNTSMRDSVFIFGARYNDSYGKELKQYVDKTILIKPLEAIEFVVAEHEDIGGAGASFLLKWGAAANADQLLVQAVMIGTSDNLGISFVTSAKKISPQQ